MVDHAIGREMDRLRLSRATCALVQHRITDCFHSNTADHRRGKPSTTEKWKASLDRYGDAPPQGHPACSSAHSGRHRLGLITVQERGRLLTKSLTNVIHILSKLWTTRRRRTGNGFKQLDPTNTVQAKKISRWVWNRLDHIGINAEGAVMHDETADLAPIDLIRPVPPRIQRRRDLLASFNIPVGLRKTFIKFTEAETAVLSIISDEVIRHGACTLTNAAIADLSGTSRSTVQDAVHTAEAEGLIKVARGSRNNTITVSAKWKAWLDRYSEAPRTDQVAGSSGRAPAA
jgi:hypothetical protein